MRAHLSKSPNKRVIQEHFIMGGTLPKKRTSTSPNGVVVHNISRGNVPQ